MFCNVCMNGTDEISHRLIGRTSTEGCLERIKYLKNFLEGRLKKLMEVNIIQALKVENVMHSTTINCYLAVLPLLNRASSFLW